MVLLRTRSVFACKTEATIGQAESLTNAEAAYNVYNFEITPAMDVASREGQGSAGRPAGVPGAQSATATFLTDLAWDGTSTLPNIANVLLPACGYVNNSGTFTPRTEAPGSNVKTITLARYLDGTRELIYGAAGTFRIVCNSGQAVFFEWTFTGLWEGETDTSMLTPTYPNPQKVYYKSAVTRYNGIDLHCANVTFDSGNTIKLRETGSKKGWHSALVTDRMPVITCDPEKKLNSVHNLKNKWIDGDEHGFSLLLTGADGATVEINAPKAQITTMSPAERERLAVESLTLQCNRNGSNVDQDVSIIFLEAS